MKLPFRILLLCALSVVSLRAYHGEDLRECNAGEYIPDFIPCNGTCSANRCLKTAAGDGEAAECVQPKRSCDSALGHCIVHDYFDPGPAEFPEEVCPGCEDDGAFVVLCDGKPICSDVPCGQSGSLFCPTPVGGWEDSRRLCEVPGEFIALATSSP